MQAENTVANTRWPLVSNDSRRMNSVVLGFFLLTVFLWASIGGNYVFAKESAQPPLPTVQLQINDAVLTAELAASPQQRFMGLSFRPSLGENEGMLFVYSSEQNLIFTMRNTLIPLSIAFISKDLVINEIHHMNVGPGQRFPAQKPAQFALEVDQGWFAANNISVGDQIIRR